MRSLKDDPKDSIFNGVLVGVPTFGMVSINFALNQPTLGAPIFTSRAYMPVVRKPVDVARNEIAYTALGKNYGFVLFRDDDVIAPHDALVKLMGRMSPKQRAKPRETAEAIVGGVVYSKVKPPQPMIYRANVTGGFEDWNYGDLVEADSIGMGCALIPTGVFRKILDDGLDKFQCVNDGCSVNWGAVYDKKTEKCPHCGVPLVPIFFKTVRGGEGLGYEPVEMTEDTYFCLLAKDSGIPTYADCGVQCEHECTETGTIFYFNKDAGVPVWQSEGVVDFWPRIDGGPSGEAQEAKSVGKKNGKIKFNLGSGGVNKKGYINIDLFTDSDFRCDARDLRPAVTEYGQADEIYASHLLEHVNKSAVTVTVRNWLKALKPGGYLYIEAPDAVAAMKEFLEIDSQKNAKIGEYDWKESVVFGAQRYQGDGHQSAITKNKMNRIIASCKNMIEKYEIKTGRPKGSNQDVIMAKIWKKKTVKPKKEKK